MENNTSISLYIGSTFTSEPIKLPIQWWCMQFGVATSVTFLPYEQVLYSLIESDMNANSVYILLVRLVDWLRDTDYSDVITCKKQLEFHYKSLLDFIRQSNKKDQLLVVFTPHEEIQKYNKELTTFIASFYTRISHDIENISYVRYLSLASLTEVYAIDSWYDAHRDKAGHIPFTDAFFVSMATCIARKLVAMFRKPFKVLIMDCDDTLWSGVCSEEDVHVLPEFQYLQHKVLELYKSGWLLCLCSKNEEKDVFNILDTYTDMLLKRHHFVSWRINWNDKGDNVQDIIQELNIQPESVVFLDNSAAECASVIKKCPDVLVIRMPEAIEQIPCFINHVWAFDQNGIVSQEDQIRSTLYQQEKQRYADMDIADSSHNCKDYLKSLELCVGLFEPNDTILNRVSQLSLRTNQFNLNGIPLRLNDLHSCMNEKNRFFRVVYVRDKFGSYGCCGAILGISYKDYLIIETFLLSCRVLGKDVEFAVLAAIRQETLKRGIYLVKAKYIKTEKNEYVKNFLQKTGWHPSVSKLFDKEYIIDVKKLPEEITYVKLDCANRELYLPREIGTPSHDNIVDKIIEPKRETHHQFVWHVFHPQQTFMAYRHEAHLMALEYHTGGQLLKLPIYTKSHSQSTASYIEPQSTLEKTIVRIWEDVLKVHRIGIRDNFYDIGGNSISAAIIEAELCKADSRLCGIEFALLMKDYTTIESIVQQIEKG